MRPVRRSHCDGELFWYLSHGFDAPDGRRAMPGFATALSSEGRWDLIDYLQMLEISQLAVKNSGYRSGCRPGPKSHPQARAGRRSPEHLDAADEQGDDNRGLCDG